MQHRIVLLFVLISACDQAELAGDAPAGEQTRAPQPASVQVLPIYAEPGMQSALDEVALWQSAEPDGCAAAPPVECGELPTIGAPALLVDGAFADADEVPLFSSVAALFPFAHPACELGCADVSLTVLIGEGGDGGRVIGSLPVDVPCSTADSDVWLAVDFNRVVLPEHYTAQLKLTDRCGASVESPALVFAAQ